VVGPDGLVVENLTGRNASSGRKMERRTPEQFGVTRAFRRTDADRAVGGTVARANSSDADSIRERRRALERELAESQGKPVEELLAQWRGEDEAAKTARAAAQKEATDRYIAKLDALVKWVDAFREKPEEVKAKLAGYGFADRGALEAELNRARQVQAGRDGKLLDELANQEKARDDKALEEARQGVTDAEGSLAWWREQLKRLDAGATAGRPPGDPATEPVTTDVAIEQIRQWQATVADRAAVVVKLENKSGAAADMAAALKRQSDELALQLTLQERATAEYDRQTEAMADQLRLLRQRKQEDAADALERELLNRPVDRAALTMDPLDDATAERKRDVDLADLEQRISDRQRRELDESRQKQIQRARDAVELARVDIGVAPTTVAEQAATERLQAALRTLAAAYATVGDRVAYARTQQDLWNLAKERANKLTVGQEILSAGSPGGVADWLRRTGRGASSDLSGMVPGYIPPSGLITGKGDELDGGQIGRDIGKAAGGRLRQLVKTVATETVEGLLAGN
jgi:hypothetical protein